MQTFEEILKEWTTKKRRMGCVSAAEWFCERMNGFYPIRKRFYLEGGTEENGNFWEHVVITNGIIEIDVTPYNNKPKEY